MNYLMSSGDDRIKSSAKDVFKVDLKLSKDLGIRESILEASAALGKRTEK